jgi:hypothetical protein
MKNPGEDNTETNNADQSISNGDKYIQDWELFESIVCNEPFSVKIAARRLKEKSFNLSEFESFLNFFRDLYLTDGNTNERFNQLIFKSNDRKIFVSNVLTGTLPETHDIILSMVIISYRLRIDYYALTQGDNRLIHLKSIENATKFLHSLLVYFK